MKKQFRKTWGIPMLLAAGTLFGLLAALLGTGFWYWLSWMAMIIPLLVICEKWLRSTRCLKGYKS